MSAASLGEKWRRPLQRFGDDIWVNGYPLSVAGLWDIGEVVVAGVEPLRLAVGSTR